MGECSYSNIFKFGSCSSDLKNKISDFLKWTKTELKESVAKLSKRTRFFIKKLLYILSPFNLIFWRCRPQLITLQVCWVCIPTIKCEIDESSKRIFRLSNELSGKFTRCNSWRVSLLIFKNRSASAGERVPKSSVFTESPGEVNCPMKQMLVLLVL